MMKCACFRLVFLLVAILVSGCSAPVPQTGRITPASPTWTLIVLTSTPIPVPSTSAPTAMTALEIVDDQPAMPSYDWSPSLVVTDTNPLSREEITRQLFTPWMEQFTRADANPSYKIKDFDLLEGDANDYYAVCALIQGAEFVADVSVDIHFDGNLERSSWAAGGGNVSYNHITKSLTIAIFNNQGTYTMKDIGSCN